MKKIVLLSMIALLIMGSFVALGAPVTILRASTNTANWSAVATSTIAIATGTGRYTTLAAVLGTVFMPFDATLTTASITWNVTISQWIFVDIYHTTYTAHVDLPGDYALDHLSFHVTSNGWVGVDFISGGNLTKTGTPATMASWLGIEKFNYSGTPPILGTVEPTFAWAPMVGLTGSDLFDGGKILTPDSEHPCGGGDIEYTLWFGFRVGQYQCKGDYSTYINFVLTPDP